MAENLGIYHLDSWDIGKGWITVDIETRGQGTLTIYINNILKQTATIGAGDIGYGTNFYVGAGTHTVKAVGTGNSQTTSVTIKPIEPTCSDVKTTVKSVNHDSILPSTPSTPFFISINKIKLECLSNSALTKNMTGEIGTVTLGSISAQFPIPSPGQSDGEVYFDLSKLIDLSPLITGTASTIKPSEAEFELRARKEGRLGTTSGYIVPITEVQAYVTAKNPRTTVEQQPYGSAWYGAYKIIRQDGSYFWATEWSMINKYL